MLPQDHWGAEGEGSVPSELTRSCLPPPPPPPLPHQSLSQIPENGSPCSSGAPVSPVPQDPKEKGCRFRGSPIPCWTPPRTLPSHSSPGLAPLAPIHHCSSWSLDRPDSMVTPFCTPPDGHAPGHAGLPPLLHSTSSLPRRPSPPQEMTGPGPPATEEGRSGNISQYYNAQHAPGRGRASPEEELSELDTLYQASLQAGYAPPWTPQSANSPAGGKPGPVAGRKLLSGMVAPGRSRTPTAEIERTVYRAPDCSSTRDYQHTVTSGHEAFEGDEESYSPENLRRVARSLSGTAIGARHQRLAVSRSF
ncbi:hypothetical protein JZ751_008011, partial [Albula glossodonta]